MKFINGFLRLFYFLLGLVLGLAGVLLLMVCGVIGFAGMLVGVVGGGLIIMAVILGIRSFD